MPFHIDHTGKAPIDAYFRVKEASGQPDSDGDETREEESGPETETDPKSTPTADKTRFVSAFRGRTVQGLEIGVPEGYGGIVLRDRVGRSTMMDGETAQNLYPSATFSSFVLWNADVPVDEGKDEYVRSLTEWMKLSEEVIIIF
jgi:hypothetical protein